MTEQLHSNNVSRAAVLGGSIAGLMSTLVLLKQGLAVTLYEKRKEYNRNIQWTARQCFINYLACLNPSIAKKFMDISSAIPNGASFLADKCTFYKYGAYLHEERDLPFNGISKTQDWSAESTLNEKNVCLVPAKELEKLLYKEIEQLSGVTIYNNESPKIDYDKNSNTYSLNENGKIVFYDLIVVCEGASSRTRNDANISSIALSRPVKQVSGEVKLRRNGMIVERLHAIKGKDKLREELLLSFLISTDKHKQESWIAGDVSDAFMTKLNRYSDFDSEPAKKLIEEEFRRIAARTLLVPEQHIIEAGYQGVVKDIKLFDLQAKISNKATAGNNLVLVGDAVGEGHWSVGGGMHVAAVCHTNRLQHLVISIKQNCYEKAAALKIYNDGVLEDTIQWISRGIKNYYLTIPEDVITNVFNKLIRQIKLDSRMDFPEELKNQIISVYFK